MLFASFDFLLFFIPILVGYWLLSHRPVARGLLLVGGSYFFYMASSRPPDGGLPTPWYYAGLLVLSTVLDYGCGNQIHRLDGELDSSDSAISNSARRRRNAWLTLSLVVNLGLLAYFKYTGFLVEAASDLAAAVGMEWAAPQLRLILPLGISFYTFQTLSYTIDIWRRTLTPEPSFRRFALYVVFFPQLVAGPIVRASEFLPQLHKRPRLTREDLDFGLFRIFKGLAKKVLIGDLVGAFLVDIVFETPGDYSSLEILLALYGFTLQIYADFAGYSDIAIGVARLLGFKIPENFDRPHQARNIGEFWRRWHMTLSTWLRDYLFFPLGGSRRSTARTYFNLWLTMFLVGMWHQQPNSGWNFVVYANLHGAAIVFNRWNRLRNKERPVPVQLAIVGCGALVFSLISYTLGLSLLQLEFATAVRLGAIAAGLFLFAALLPLTKGWINATLHILLTFHFTVLSRIFFRADGLGPARQMIRKLLEWDGQWVREGLFRLQQPQQWVLDTLHGPLAEAGIWLTEYATLIVLVLGTAYHFTPRRWVDTDLYKLFRKLPGPVVALLYGALGVLIMKLLTGPRANIYFEF